MDQLSESVEEIVTQINATAENAQIAAELSQQTASADQISLGLNEIKLVVENNSNTAQNSAAASEELSGQANMMEQMIMQFRIKE